MKWFLALSIGVALTAIVSFSRSRPAEIRFQKHLIDIGASESAAWADINGDGRLDIVSGDTWYESPRWTPHKFRQLDFVATPFDNYIDNFSDLAVDVNGDGRIDIVSCAWFGKTLNWFENPGKGQGMWKMHPIDTGFNIEFCFLVDLDNDGKAREVIPQFGPKNAPLAWYEIKNGGFEKHVIANESYGHGIGVGDVNGDGRNDILTPKGWFEAPVDMRAGKWTFHPEWDMDKAAAAYMHVIDINGDGRNDVLSSNAHDYGLYWLENMGGGKWTKHMIDESWSQPHAITLVDLNGDGKKDVLTGKRYMAHSRDPGSKEPNGIYWYEYDKAANGKTIEWTRHIIDYSSSAGAGMQLPAADMDGDGDLDFIAPGKSGLFLFENLTKRKLQGYSK